MTKPIFSEWFGTEAEARGAARRVDAKGGYTTSVRQAVRADSRRLWLLEVF